MPIPCAVRVRSLLKTLSETGFFSIAGSTIVNRILSFISGILVVRILSKADYGVYSYAYNILNIALLFNGLGVASAFIQLCSERGGNKKERALERFGMALGGGFDLLLSLGLFLWATLVPEDMPGTRALLQLCALFPIPQFIFDMQSAALRSQLRNNDYAMSNIVNTACIVVGTILGALLFGVVGLLVCRVVAICVSVVIIFIRYGVPLMLKRETASSDASTVLPSHERRDYVKIATSSALANGISSFTFLIGTFMIGQLLADPVEVASYEAASAIPVALNFIPATIMVYVYPYFARRNDDYPWVRRNFVRLLALTFAGFGVIALICLIWAPQIVELVYGAQYLSSAPAFRVLIVGSWVGAAFRTVSGNLLVTQRLVIANVINAAITVLAILSLNLPLVPTMGAMGSAIAQTVGLCLSGLLNTAVFTATINQREKRTRHAA